MMIIIRFRQCNSILAAMGECVPIEIKPSFAVKIAKSVCMCGDMYGLMEKKKNKKKMEKAVLGSHRTGSMVLHQLLNTFNKDASQGAKVQQML